MKKKYLGIVLIILGVVLTFWGYNEYNSVNSQFSRALSSETPLQIWLAMLGGIVLVGFGIYRIK